LRGLGGHPATLPGNSIVFTFDDRYGRPIKSLRDMGQVVDLGGMQIEQLDEDEEIEDEDDLQFARVRKRARKVLVRVGEDVSGSDLSMMADEIEIYGGTDVAIYSNTRSIKGFDRFTEHMTSDGIISYAVRSKGVDMTSPNGYVVALRPDKGIKMDTKPSRQEGVSGARVNANQVLINNAVTVQFPDTDIKPGATIREFKSGGRSPIGFGVVGSNVFAIMDKAQLDEQGPMFEAVVRFGRDTGRAGVIMDQDNLLPGARALHTVALAGVKVSGGMVRRKSDGRELSLP